MRIINTSTYGLKLDNDDLKYGCIRYSQSFQLLRIKVFNNCNVIYIRVTC